jgi:PPOX class probable F420-dependent enzyme
VDLEVQALTERFAHARVARFATVSGEAEPHLVAVTFALRNQAVVIAVDHKPKTSTNLKRIRNIRANSKVTLLVDEYDDRDWSNLWWVRVDGTARVLQSAHDRFLALEWLCDKYPQYQENPPQGPVIWIDIEAVSGWSYRP